MTKPIEVKDMKFCRDCKWVMRERFTLFGGFDKAKCARFPHLVTGEAQEGCSYMRLYGFCGEDGKFFEPK